MKASRFTLPVVVCLMGGAIWWFSTHPQSLAQLTTPSTAFFNSIEPAGGPEDTDEDAQPLHARNGKLLSKEADIPVITIGGLKVEGIKQQQEALSAYLTPASLKNPSDQQLLERHFSFTPYAHNPTRGNPDSPLTVVEFTDLACGQCFPYMAKEDAAVAAAGNVRQTSIHLPVNRYNDTNLAAFYGKIAQLNGKFWDYRTALMQNPPKESEDLIKALIGVGVQERAARQSLLTNARQFYRELDADAKLAQALGLSRPPHFYVNGISVGEDAIDREKVGDVISFLHAKEQNGAP